MIIATTVAEVREHVQSWKMNGLSIGLVPTMGFLHEGHASLMERATRECDRVVVSIFVNPIQFGPTEDLESYPRDFESDSALCAEKGVALVFHPEATEMYAPDFCTYVDMDRVTKTLCGASRPTHFRGVCTVVSKLINITKPDRSYFGQKDAQQLAVVRRMVRDLDMDVEIIGCPIVRETDGLAKSSRNTYLRPEERIAALVLSRALGAGRQMVAEGGRDSNEILSVMRSVIDTEPLARIDYVEIVDGVSMQPIESVNTGTLIAMAVYIGRTRLIDNFIVGE
ncbi:MAG: pantoate--beta-alanine ligase [Actinobacteria bacterium]|nr:pantoate--beta-alanine ligase [Actinomycetota bacterium]